MIDLKKFEYIVTVQCDIVMERCPGYFCERAFHERTGGFAIYDPDKKYRNLHLTCGGCCGRALHRKLALLLSKIKKYDGIEKEQIVVQFASCITKDNHHGPVCPHYDYLKTLVQKLGLDYLEDTHISKKAQERRDAGIYPL